MYPTKTEMIEVQLKARGIKDPNVLKAMEEVDRVDFVPAGMEDRAYSDGPLPIGEGQTISQPYIVAYMAEALKLEYGDKVLEVGAGCGYNAAVLSKIASHVYTTEIVEWLATLAKGNLLKAGIENVTVRAGDGYQGWPEEGPFDAIILTAAPKQIPEPLKQQLKIGGKLLAPVGGSFQQLILLEKIGEGEFSQRSLISVQFVPMTGKAQY
jgi:protein-L-isoaspartate(D-aspartate) O-methyltransferase